MHVHASPQCAPACTRVRGQPSLTVVLQLYKLALHSQSRTTCACSSAQPSANDHTHTLPPCASYCAYDVRTCTCAHAVNALMRACVRWLATSLAVAKCGSRFIAAVSSVVSREPPCDQIQIGQRLGRCKVIHANARGQERIWKERQAQLAVAQQRQQDERGQEHLGHSSDGRDEQRMLDRSQMREGRGTLRGT